MNMAAQDPGINVFTMWKVGKGRVKIPRGTDPVTYAQEHGGVTVFKGTNWQTAIPIWNIKKGMLV